MPKTLSEDAPAATAWRNRIIGEGEESPEQLLANPKNWRVHPKHQQDALEGVLNQVGWVQRVIVNQRNQTLIDGHLRVSLALRRHEPVVPVEYVDLDENEEALILATLDPLAAMAATDAQQLEALLRDVETEEAAVEAMLADLAASHDLDLAGELALDEEADESGSALALLDLGVGTPRHEVWPADVYYLGDHVLVIADVFTGWAQWVPFLDRPDTVLVPYPGPLVPLGERGAKYRMVLVQPDRYVAGHMLDRYAEIHGDEGIRHG